MTCQTEIRLFAAVVLVAIGATVWFLIPPVAPLTVFEGGWVGFKAISCGPTACIAPTKYCMKFRNGATWCVDEYRIYQRCPRGDACVLIEVVA